MSGVTEREVFFRFSENRHSISLASVLQLMFHVLDNKLDFHFIFDTFSSLLAADDSSGSNGDSNEEKVMELTLDQFSSLMLKCGKKKCDSHPNSLELFLYDLHLSFEKHSVPNSSLSPLFSTSTLAWFHKYDTILKRSFCSFSNSDIPHNASLTWNEAMRLNRCISEMEICSWLSSHNLIPSFISSQDDLVLQEEMGKIFERKHPLLLSPREMLFPQFLELLANVSTRIGFELLRQLISANTDHHHPQNNHPEEGDDKPLLREGGGKRVQFQSMIPIPDKKKSEDDEDEEEDLSRSETPLIDDEGQDLIKFPLMHLEISLPLFLCYIGYTTLEELPPHLIQSLQESISTLSHLLEDPEISLDLINATTNESNRVDGTDDNDIGGAIDSFERVVGFQDEYPPHEVLKAISKVPSLQTLPSSITTDPTNKQANICTIEFVISQIEDRILQTISENPVIQLNSSTSILQASNQTTEGPPPLNRTKPVVILDTIPIPPRAPPVVFQLIEASLCHSNAGYYESSLKFLEAARIEWDTYRVDDCFFIKKRDLQLLLNFNLSSYFFFW